LSSPLHAAIETYVSRFDQEAIEEAYMGGGTFLTGTFGTKNNQRGVFDNFTQAITGINFAATSGAPEVMANDIFGGFEEGNYLGVTANSTVTATFAQPVKYFGLYVSAVDANNRIQLYSGTTLLLDFSAATLTAMLPNNPTSTIRAVDGSVYNTNQYYGQPGTTNNSTEPYVYLSFFATGDTTITHAVLSETGAIFETDNYSISTTAVAPASSLVVVPVPEPNAAICVGIAAVGLLAWRGRRATRRI
jgi:hypothetical protein